MSNEQNPAPPSKTRTLGEEQQIENLKKYSKNISEIEKVRGRLERAGYGEAKPEKQDPADRGPIVYGNSAKKQPKRREEDTQVFTFTGQGFFRSLLNTLFGRSVILASGKNNGKIKKGIGFLLRYRCAYVLDDKVIEFIDEYIMKWQNKMLPMFEALYRRGWRTSDGRKTLSAEQFNIISAVSRLAGCSRLREIRRERYNTLEVYDISNSFIYIYYQLKKHGISKLLESFQNALYAFIAENPQKKLPSEPENYVNSVKSFFDGSVEKDFLLPLLEAVSGSPKTAEQTIYSSRTSSIEIEEYKAGPQLTSVMKAREDKYTKKKSLLEKQVSEELEFIEIVVSDLDKNYTVSSRVMDPLEVSFYLMKNISKNQKHIVRELFCAIKFFNEYYGSILTMSFPARLQAGTEHIQLFTKEVFSGHLKNIISMANSLKSLLNDTDYANFLENLTEDETEKLEYAAVFFDICSAFSEMAEMLTHVSTPTSIKRPAARPITQAQIQSLLVPHTEYQAEHQNPDPQKEKVFSIQGIKVGDLINDIRAFCFHFTVYFQPTMIIRDRKIARSKTLNSRIQKRQKYRNFLNELKTDDNLKLPDSLEEI